MDTSILILDAQQVKSLLDGQERKLAELVSDAYIVHRRGASSLPHSTFVHFPEMKRERIIALPAFLGGGFNVAGMKWIASFPDNTRHGIDRASALIVLNSVENGRPTVVMEGASISAKRTAASAALAARALSSEGDGSQRSACLVGCGPINMEIARFLISLIPELEQFHLYDIHSEKSAILRQQLLSAFPGIQVDTVDSMPKALQSSPLVSLATTATTPHIGSLNGCREGSTILHISLRDLQVDCILGADNVTDDFDHAFRANTSLHLAEQQTGSRDFVRTTLADILAGDAPARALGKSMSIFSPFGLGVLDLAVAQWVLERATEAGIGTRVPFFPPASTDAGVIGKQVEASA